MSSDEQPAVPVPGQMDAMDVLPEHDHERDDAAGPATEPEDINPRSLAGMPCAAPWDAE